MEGVKTRKHWAQCLAWGHCVICPGVTTGNNSVIGAGSVVVRDIPANRVAVGNPCRIIKEVGE
jgi:acetyltransferase-like isoleucine patch superfamily enzyme